MPMNHFSSQLPPPDWYPQPQQRNHGVMDSHSQNSSSNTTSFWPAPQFFTSQNCSLDFDLNNEEESEINHEHLSEDKDQNIIKQIEEEEEGCLVEIPKEALFEKPLTPSDVGKLNRLVIPKQHAEKYFPLNGVNESGEKGLLLSFEDEIGKPWRFRYSYWNSSQSYVLTKGWSRFVKEKRLDAGDVVQFERHRVDGARFFIGWRRRGSESKQPVTAAVASGGGGWTRVLLSGQPYPGQTHHGPALPYPPDYFHAGGGMQRGTTESGMCKRVRLFGVNLECQPEAPAPSDDSGSSASSNQGPEPPNHHHPYHYYPNFHASFNHPSHVDVNFPRERSNTRYQQG